MFVCAFRQELGGGAIVRSRDEYDRRRGIRTTKIAEQSGEQECVAYCGALEKSDTTNRITRRGGALALKREWREERDAGVPVDALEERTTTRSGPGALATADCAHTELPCGGIGR